MKQVIGLAEKPSRLPRNPSERRKRERSAAVVGEDEGTCGPTPYVLMHTDLVGCISYSSLLPVDPLVRIISLAQSLR